jgi:uncharacterized secreted repeat protein (TIGR03808 family)
VLPTGARLIGVPGATRFVAIDNTPLIVARGADYILLSGITFDGSGKALPENAGLVQLAAGRGIAIRDCEIIGSGRNGIVFENIEGEITGTTITGALAAAIHALDSRGLTIARNTIRDIANNGIQVWRSQEDDDGTQVIDNRIEDVAATASAMPPSRPCAAMPPPTSRSPTTRARRWAKSRSTRNSASRAR